MEGRTSGHTPAPTGWTCSEAGPCGGGGGATHAHPTRYRGHHGEGLEPGSPPSTRGPDQRGEATGPGPQSQLEFEPGSSCPTRSSRGTSPLPRHSPQGARGPGAQGCVSRGAASPRGAGGAAVPPPPTCHSQPDPGWPQEVGKRTVRETEAGTGCVCVCDPPGWVAHLTCSPGSLQGLRWPRVRSLGHLRWGRPGRRRWQRPTPNSQQTLGCPEPAPGNPRGQSYPLGGRLQDNSRVTCGPRLLPGPAKGTRVPSGTTRTNHSSAAWGTGEQARDCGCRDSGVRRTQPTGAQPTGRQQHGTRGQD